jgi:hypothetical protein
VRQKGRQNRYTDVDSADMVAAGYTNNEHDDNHDGPRQGNRYCGSSSRRAGRDSRQNMEWRRRRDQTPPSTYEIQNGECHRHTYIDKGRQAKPGTAPHRVR